jgi:DNA-binding LacI/PurR family transcriptional regulator
MRGHGLAAEIRVLPGGSGEADGARAARDLLTDPPTAVTVFNDHSATGILNVFRSAGLRVPEDVSVVGYDDSSLSRLAHIDMTTIAQDAGMLTRLAVARAADRIESAPVNHREIVIPPRLVVRATTGPVRGS